MLAQLAAARHDRRAKTTSGRRLRLLGIVGVSDLVFVRSLAGSRVRPLDLRLAIGVIAGRNQRLMSSPTAGFGVRSVSVDERSVSFCIGSLLADLINDL